VPVAQDVLQVEDVGEELGSRRHRCGQRREQGKARPINATSSRIADQ
jgi:hypothetical protein